MTAFMGNALAITRKDIALEFRGRESMSLMFFLSLLFLVIFNISLDLDNEKTSSLASGILWVIFAFTGILGMGRTSMAERDEDAYLSIVFSPASAESLYIGKVISNLVLLLFPCVDTDGYVPLRLRINRHFQHVVQPWRRFRAPFRRRQQDVQRAIFRF